MHAALETLARAQRSPHFRRRSRGRESAAVPSAKSKGPHEATSITVRNRRLELRHEPPHTGRLRRTVMPSLNSYGARSTLNVGGTDYTIYKIDAVGPTVSRLPFSLKILLENLVRAEDNLTVTKEDIATLANWDAK